MNRILIVEDEKPISNLIKTNLSDAGYHCTCAFDGEEARKAITKDGKISMVGKVNEANGYSISICDNGRGMEQSEISRITEAFYMVDKSRARSQGGAGLGLSICSDIVKLHEGTLAFNSRLGLGTCAIIKLKGENAKCQS